MRTWWIKHVILMGVVGLLCNATSAIASDRVSARKGDPAPDFELSQLDGGSVRLSTLRGKVVLLYFFSAPTCSLFCLPEMQSLQTLHDTFKRADLEILAVAVFQMTEQVTKPFVLKTGAQYPILYDTPGSNVFGLYGGKNHVPISVLIDRKGVIRAKNYGARDWESEFAVELIREIVMSP